MLGLTQEDMGDSFVNVFLTREAAGISTTSFWWIRIIWR